MSQFAAFSILCLLVLSSCSDDNGTNNPPVTASDYYQLEVGNYWVYNIEVLDSNNIPTAGATLQDSTVIVSSMSYFGKTAFLAVHYISNGTQDSSYLAIEGSKLFTYSTDLGNEQFKVPYGAWILTADMNGTTWTNIDSSLSMPVTISEVSGTLTAQLKLTGEKNPNENLAINATNVNCLVFTQTAMISGIFDITITQIPISQTIPIKQYYGKNNGLVKAYQPSTFLQLPIIGKMWINGFSQTLIRSNVKL